MSDSPAEALPDLPRWAVVTPRRMRHIARVVGLVERWASKRGIAPGEAARWRRAAVLHDALRDAPDDVLAWYGPAPAGWPHGIWHGPAAAAAAERDGERDAGVLAAVRYHSLGFAGWDDAGKVLFLADALEAGRTHERAALDRLAARAAREPAAVLLEVVAIKLGWLVRIRRPIVRETWEFWNRLVADASQSSR